MKPEVLDFILWLLEDTDKHIEVEDRYHVAAKQKGQAQIKMCYDQGDPFITTLHNVILAPYLCNGLFLIIALMNLGHTCLFHKEFCTVKFIEKKKIQLHYHILHRGNMNFWGK